MGINELCICYYLYQGHLKSVEYKSNDIVLLNSTFLYLF